MWWEPSYCFNRVLLRSPGSTRVLLTADLVAGVVTLAVLTAFAAWIYWACASDCRSSSKSWAASRCGVFDLFWATRCARRLCISILLVIRRDPFDSAASLCVRYVPRSSARTFSTGAFGVGSEIHFGMALGSRKYLRYPSSNVLLCSVLVA